MGRFATLTSRRVELTAPERCSVGTLTLGGLPDHALSTPRRLDHHLLLLVTAGHGCVWVDFVEHTSRPGTVIWIRRGQVVRRPPRPGLDAVGLLWRPGTLAQLAQPDLESEFGPTRWQLTGEDEDAVINEVSQLVVDCQRHHSGHLSAELLHHQLAVLLMRIALLPPAEGGTAAGNGVFQSFRREVERSYRRTRRVEDYATLLGCSVRTLTRACLAATGRSAKQVIDDRTALEAKRMLACGEAPVAQIGARLGFPEPTNFSRFFAREVGRSPGEFRAAAALDSMPPGDTGPASGFLPRQRGSGPRLAGGRGDAA